MEEGERTPFCTHIFGRNTHACFLRKQKQAAGCCSPSCSSIQLVVVFGFPRLNYCLTFARLIYSSAATIPYHGRQKNIVIVYYYSMWHVCLFILLFHHLCVLSELLHTCSSPCSLPTFLHCLFLPHVSQHTLCLPFWSLSPPALMCVLPCLYGGCINFFCQQFLFTPPVDKRDFCGCTPACPCFLSFSVSFSLRPHMARPLSLHRVLARTEACLCV